MPRPVVPILLAPPSRHRSRAMWWGRMMWALWEMSSRPVQVEPAVTQIFHFLEEDLQVQDHAGSHHQEASGVQGAAGHLVQGHGLAVHDDRMAGVVAALEPGDVPEAGAQEIHQFAFAFIPPLQAEDGKIRCCQCHARPPTFRLPRPPSGHSGNSSRQTPSPGTKSGHQRPDEDTLDYPTLAPDGVIWAGPFPRGEPCSKSSLKKPAASCSSPATRRASSVPKASRAGICSWVCCGRRRRPPSSCWTAWGSRPTCCGSA